MVVGSWKSSSSLFQYTFLSDMSSSSSFSEEEPASRGEEDEAPPPSLPAPEATLPVPNNAPPAPPADPFKKATWADVVYDEEGGVIGILGREWRVINAKDVRSVCMSLGLSGGLRTTKKEDMINRIIAAAFNRPKYARLVAEEYNSSDDDDDETPKLVGATRRNKTKKKGKFCNSKGGPVSIPIDESSVFRPIRTGFWRTRTDRQTLDAGKAAHGQHFWEKVQKAFVDASAFMMVPSSTTGISCQFPPKKFPPPLSVSRHPSALGPC